jgi:very-short-patch-repair endonuclease
MAQKQQLVTLGARDLDLTRAVKNGEVVRARNGWYSIWSETDPRLRAVRVGGRLTGLSAVAQLGGWVIGTHPLHVSVHDNSARLRNQWNRGIPHRVASPVGVKIHWDEPAVARRGSAASVDIVDALARVVIDEDFETAIVALDWALHVGQIDRIDFEQLILGLPVDRRGIRDWVDGNCESPPESVARTRLRLDGHAVRSQEPLGDLQRIDLVVDGTVGIEVDGEEFHRDRFEPDRSKDLDITIAEFHGLRPSANQVFRDWARVAKAVEVALAKRGIRPPTFGNSGDRPRHPSKSPGISGWRRRSHRQSPEFPNARREYGGRGSVGD